MAFALVMADKQWGGQLKALKKNYIDIAKGPNRGLEQRSLPIQVPQAVAGDDLPAVNLSYFAPAYYKVFAKVDTTNTSNWNTLTTTMYGVLAASLNSSNGNTTNGLVPAWCDTSGKPNAGAFGATGGASPTNYQYDSCRTPFRIGLDYCWTGDTNAPGLRGQDQQFLQRDGRRGDQDRRRLRPERERRTPSTKPAPMRRFSPRRSWAPRAWAP
jgi:endo-1,4-beta-D-glucanase Y